ncbi:protein LSM12, partial [Phenoliferia sp. Uapishka_3]
MATRGSSPLPPRKPAQNQNQNQNSRRTSTTPKPGASTTTTPATSLPPSRLPTPPPAAPSTPTPIHSLSTLLSLPLSLTLSANGTIPERTITGSLWSYDASLSLVVLSSPSTSPSAPKSSRSYTFVKTPQIKSIVALSTTPDETLPTLAEALRSMSVKEAEARVEKAVVEDKKMRARVGKGVSEEAQAIFDALGKTLPVRWHERQIVVMDEVLISAPYGVADVKGGKGAGERIERVRKVVRPSLRSCLSLARPSEQILTSIDPSSWKESADGSALQPHNQQALSRDASRGKARRGKVGRDEVERRRAATDMGVVGSEGLGGRVFTLIVWTAKKSRRENGETPWSRILCTLLVQPVLDSP